MMRLLPLTIVLCLTLMACSVPEPTSSYTVRKPLNSDLATETKVALAVTSQATTSGPAWAYRADDAATELQGKIRYRLLDAGLVNQVVDPGEQATHDMSVTIVAFEHEAPNVDATEGDGFNEFAAEIKVVDRASSETTIAYDVKAQSGSEGGYGKNFPSLIGIEPMLDAAATGIIDGLRAASEGADRSASIAN